MVAVLSISLMASAFISCDDKDRTTNPDPGEEVTIMEKIQSSGDFDTLAELLEGTTLTTALSGTGPVTIFAPTDAVFAELEDGYLDGLSAQQKLDIIGYHIVNGQIIFGDESVTEAREYASEQGDIIYVDYTTSQKLVNNNAKVVIADIEASNGFIHTVDKLLLPDAYGTVLENIRKRPDYKVLYEMVLQLNLGSELEGEGPISFMAPKNQVLNNLENDLDWDLSEEEWSEILKYHVLNEDISGVGPGTRTRLVSMSGDSLYLIVDIPNQFKINFDVSAEPIHSLNGHIYKLDGVLLPDKYVSVLTLVDKRYNPTTIRSAFAVARLTGTLYDLDDEFTVFMPKNNVPGTNSLPADEDELAELLKYHVLPVKLMAADLQDGHEYTTWQGEKITISKTGDTITINGTTQVTVADLEGRNGVVHIINQVLTLPAE